MTYRRSHIELELDLGDPLPTMAARFAGTPTRYTPPRCHDHVLGAACHHADGFHEPLPKWREENPMPLTVRKDGSAWIVPARGMRPTAAPVPIPKRTRENIAACAVHGLSYWSEADRPGELWAIDAYQRAVIVRIERRHDRSWHGDTGRSYTTEGE